MSDASDLKTTIAPMLSVQGRVKAVDFYKEGFGAVELHRKSAPDGAIVSHLEIDGARFFVADESPEHHNLNPLALGDITTVRIALIVADPDLVVDQAVAAGATLLSPVKNHHYGWRLGQILDPFGHRWEIGHPL